MHAAKDVKNAAQGVGNSIRDQLSGLGMTLYLYCKNYPESCKGGGYDDYEGFDE